jgi:protein SCO1
MLVAPEEANMQKLSWMRRRNFPAVAALLPCAFQGPVSAGPSAVAPDRADYFPNALLLNQDSRPVRFYDDLVRGNHVVAISFVFAQCADICPSTIANLAKVQPLLGQRLGREVRFASISIDPTQDTPTILKAYAARFGVWPSWQFLTGRRRDIELIRRKLGVWDRDPVRDADKTQHTGMLVYGNDARGRWGRVSCLADPQRILESVTRWI